MKYYISHHYRNLTSAGNKAKTDMEAIMQSIGYRNAGLSRTVGGSGVKAFIRNLAGVLRAAVVVGRGDVLVLQYPLKKYFSFISRIATLKGARVVALVHDLGSCRRKAISRRTELRRLGHAHTVIATNTVMENYLRSIGLETRLDALGVWDYLTDAVPATAPHTGVRIAYAGAINRRKNAFLYDWGNIIDGYDVDIYGDGFEIEQAAHPECFKCHGYTPADKLIATVSADYGLVWDGDSLDTCTGSFGEYLALNTPHKVSLYICCGLPLIVWSKSAMAQFVIDHGIGITVDSLRQIPDKISQMNPDRYAAMKLRVAEIGRKLASGHFMKQALERATH